MKFRERHSGQEVFASKAEARRIFEKRIEGWKTLPEGTDYCPECWSNMGKTDKLTAEMRKSARSTVDFAEKRQGTGVWSVVCDAHCVKWCRNEIFVRY